MFYKLLCLVSLVMSGISLQAQNTGMLTGSVSNAEGNVIPAASVYLLNSTFRTLTNSDGKFILQKVLPGTYNLQVTAPGYNTINRPVTITDDNQYIQLNLNESGEQLQEVNVFAQKKEEALQQVPLSITAFSTQQVQDQKLWDIKDLSGLIPNFYAANPGDNRNVTSIRGIATTSYDPTIATYIDGVNQFGLDTYMPRLQDIEQIEVLRGPQGTLYGRNAMGGVVNITTKQPGNATDGFAELSFGNYGLQRYNLGIRSPLIKDRLFFGAAALYTQQNGFFTNKFDASRFDDQHSFSGNYYLKYIAAPRLSVILNLKHNENRNDGAFPLAGNIEEALAAPFILDQNNTGQMVDNSLNASLSLNYTGKIFNFISQSAYQKNYRYYKQPIDADFSSLDGFAVISDYGPDWNTVKVATQEFRFSAPANNDSPFDWVAGMYAFHQRSPVRQGTHYGNDGPMMGAPANFAQINTNVGEGTGIAVFAQGTYQLAAQLKLTLGLRYDYEYKNQKIRSDLQQDGAEAMTGIADTSAKAHFDALSPKAALQYIFNPQHNVFVSYSRGFRAGGISSLGGDPSVPPLNTYQSELSNNLEIGSKHMFAGNRVRINASIFYTRVNNAQVPTLLLPDAIIVTRNAGKLSSKGAELEVSIMPVKELEIDYNLGLTDAKYTNLIIPSNGATHNLVNNRQIFTPNYTSVLAAQYTHELSAGLKLMTRGEFRRFGKQYFDLANQLEQQAYGIFNARIGISTKRFDLFVWAANLADKQYIDYAYDFGPAHMANPRTFGITLRSSFNIL